MKIVTEGIFLKQMLSIQNIYLIFIRILRFYQKKKLGKVEKLVCGIEDKKKYFVHIKALKQALNHRLILKKVYRVIQFNQKSWLKPYIDMNTKLRKEAKMDLKMISLS